MAKNAEQIIYSENYTMSRKLYIPIILGTPRKERMSKYVADFVFSELEKFDEVETDLIDVADLDLPTDMRAKRLKIRSFRRR